MAHDVSSAAALVRALSNQLTGPLELVIGPPGYDPETGKLALPGFPTEDLDQETLTALRAYLGHEAADMRFRTNRAAASREAQLMTDGFADAWVDRQLGEEFPGVAQNLQQELATVAREVLATADQFEPSYNMLSTCCYLVQSGALELDDLLEVAPRLAPWLERLRPLLVPESSESEEAARLAGAEAVRLLQLPPPPPPPTGVNGQQSTGQGGQEGPQQQGQQPQQQQPQQQQPQQQGQQPQQQPQQSQQEQSQQPQAQNQPAQSGQQAQQEQQPLPLQAASDRTAVQMLTSNLKAQTSGPVTSYTYNPEEDVWTDVSAGNQGTLPKRLAAQAQALEIEFRQLLETPTLVTVTRLEKGEIHDLDLARLVLGETNVFKRRRRQARVQPAVVVSCDLSGSMQGNSISWVKELLYVLGTALHRLKIPFEVLGWTTTTAGGRSNRQRLYRQDTLEHTVVHRYDQVHQDIREFYGAVELLQATGATPTGEGLLVAAQRLAMRPENRKILFLLSDGAPAIHANGPTDVHDKFILKTVAQAQRAGIECVGVSIGGKELLQYLPNSVEVSKTLSSTVVTRLKKTLLRARQEVLSQ